MADIFLSYKKTDRERVAPIVALLEANGWSVWWDTRIDTGEQWDEVIEREINAANCVVAAWSFESVASRWVRTEASEGLERGILVPVFIDPTKPPLEFKLVQSVYLVGWRGGAGDPAGRTLVRAVERFLGPAPANPGPLASTPQARDPENHLREQEHWELIRKSRDPKQFSVFLATYPHGRHAGAAKARIEQLALRAERLKGMGRAMLPGLAAGLIVVVSTVLWLSSWFAGPQRKPVTAKPPAAEQGPSGASKLKSVETLPEVPRRETVAAPKPVPRREGALATPKREPPKLSIEDKSRAERFMALGTRHLEQGNIGAARIFFQRAAEAGLAAGALKMAATYDPAELVRLEAVAVTPDRNEARKWYERARELGAREAEERLARLGGN
jgi:hypothetical protein